MALKVIEAASTFAPDKTSAKIVVESDARDGNFAVAFEELKSVQCRAIAQQYAATQGMGSSRVNGNVDGPYGVDAQGTPLDALRDPQTQQQLPLTDPRMQPVAYRATVPLCQPLM